jgi:4'-phosphopantetheinyl transferase EntD
MFINNFPKSLLGLMHQTYPRHRFQAAMHALISPEEYLNRLHLVPPERYILTSTELACAQAFKLAKRQNEWLTGRICAKLAAIQYHNNDSTTNVTLQPQQIAIANTESGRPYLSGTLPSVLENVDISISHGAAHGLALAADCHCGVDIQQPQDTLIRVREKLCAHEEEELLQAILPELTELQHLTLLWSAKEAAKKTLSHLRMPGFLEVILTSVEPHAHGWVIGFLVSSRSFEKYPSTINVVAELYESYAIALCLNDEASHA